MVTEKTITQYTTSDGRAYTDKEHALAHERDIKRHRVFSELCRPLGDDASKADVIRHLVLSVSVLVRDLHKEGCLPPGYGTREDF